MTGGVGVRLTVSFVLNFIGIVVSAQSSQTCSQFCVCDIWYGLHRASCTGRHLYSIHTDAPNTVQALDLSDNVISSLDNFDIATAGLTELKYLNLSGNAISEIGLNAFRGLAELTVLDLSKNRLYHISNNLIIENTNLRILKLSRNNFNSHVPKLWSSWLTELSLDSCQISHLPLDTFNGLPLIRRLDLSNNLMIQMSSIVVQPLHSLKKLSLQGNPWSCNNVMHDLETYLQYKNVEFDGICSKATHPKKFEKMILQSVTRVQNYHRSAIAGETVHKTKSVSKNNTTDTLGTKNLSTCKNTLNETITVNSVKGSLLVYSLLLIGFIAGAISGTVISYICFTTKIFCCRRCRRNECSNDDSQRLSLLLNSWTLQDRIINDADLTESCPGTPPPPYREVLLRPSLYRCLSTVSNLNNNTAGYGERYT